MTDQTQKPKADPVRIAAILDAATVALGIVCASAGVALYSARAGLVAFGALLLGAELAGAILRR